MHQSIRHAGCFRWPELYSREPDVVVLTDIGGRRGIDPLPSIQGKVYVHDACHSWMPDPAAAFGLVSFYPTKLVPGAEGGAVICREEADAEELASWLYCGLVPGSAGQGHQPTRAGRKANMTDVTAALNREALELAPAHIRATGEAWLQLADAAFRRDIPYRYQNERPYLFQVEVPTQDDVQPLRAGLEAMGVPSAWNFRPSPLVTIPCLPGTTRSQAKDLMDKVRRLLR
jgi:dTDP-4-amino-4,6-dideoxygalactose transaminase